MRDPGGVRAPVSPVLAGVVGVGDELLYGHTVDTNGAWLGRSLSDLGIEVVHRALVGDDEEAIGRAIRRGLDEAELVLATGGLGPTPDDLTREAVALLLDLPLDTDEGVLEALRARFRARGFGELPPTNARMAQVPRGAMVLPNPRGAAPGLVMDLSPDRTLVLLPGIPGEMEGLFEQWVAPLLQDRFGERLRPVAHRFLHTTGIPESVLARKIEEAFPEGTGRVALAYLPDVRGLRLRLTVRPNPGDPPPEEELDRMEAALTPVLGHFRYRATSGDLAEAVGEALLRVGATLAVAESCTGGLVARRITDRPGSSRYFVGGIVAYDDRVKVQQLGIEPGVLEREGAVSRAVAVAMALGAADRLGARAGIGITGIAGPGGGTEEKPVGTVWYAVTLDGTVSSRKERFPGDRREVRERSAQAALHHLLALLEGRAGGWEG